MVSSVELNAFKSFGHKTIELKGLNLFMGLNSSGKSSVIQALRMVSRAASGKIADEVLLDGHGTLSELVNRNMKGEDFLLSADYGGAMPVRYDGNNEGIVYADFPDVIYIAADRFGPRDSVPVNYSHTIGPHGENMLNLYFEIRDELMPDAMRHPESEKNTVEENLQKWLQEIAPGVTINAERPRNTDLSYVQFNEFRSQNVGFGLSYVLPILIALCYSAIKGGMIVLIENPEAHLHPKGQTCMGEFLCKAAEAGVQVVVETHSDHLLDGVRIHSRKDVSKKFHDIVTINWCRINEEGFTDVETPKLDHNGRLDEWPKDMCDQFEINAVELM